MASVLSFRPCCSQLLGTWSWNRLDHRKFLGTEVKVVAAYGEYDIGTNIQDIQRGCDIICATMGRLLDFIENGRIKLNRLNYLVLDEADLFLIDTNQRQRESFYKDLVLLNGSMGMVSVKKRKFIKN
jgi:hypothetical protein